MGFGPTRSICAREPRLLAAPAFSDDEDHDGGLSPPSTPKSDYHHKPPFDADRPSDGFGSSDNPSVLDITSSGAHYMRVPAARHPGAFTAATRRVYSRRERAYDRSTPNGIILERVDTVADEPAGEERGIPESQLSPHYGARMRALNHLANAYAITAYAHAGLTVALTAVAGWAAVAFARAFAGDISRKTRARAGQLALDAAECARNMLRNDCAGAIHRAHSPAVETLCEQWKTCADQGEYADTDALSGTVWAETLAETVNAFASRISSITVVIAFVLAIVFAFALSTVAFGYMHRRLVDRRLTAADVSGMPPVQLMSHTENGQDYGVWEEVPESSFPSPAGLYKRIPGRATPLLQNSSFSAGKGATPRTIPTRS